MKAFGFEGEYQLNDIIFVISQQFLKDGFAPMHH